MQKENRISQKLLPALSEFVTDRMGLYFTRERWRDLERGVSSAAKELGFDDVDSCVRWLLTSQLTRDRVEVLAGYLTVGETYFFRDRRAFEFLERRILSELIASRREKERSLRIWSAGCATGEEAYSIAILLRRMLRDIDDWNISILATDINPHFLRKAAKSVYTDWSFRDAPGWVRQQYFRKTKGGTAELLPDTGKMVAFSYHNLVEDAYPSLLNSTNAMDVVFCRNVLMYFSPEVQRKVIKRLHSCIKEGGWLVVSPSEVSQQLFREFTAVNGSGATFYRKEKQTARDSKPEMRAPGSRIGYQAPESVEQCPVILPKPGFRPPTPVPSTPNPGPRAPAHVPPPPDMLQEALALYGKGCYAEVTERLLASPSFPEKNDAGAMELLARAFANQGKLAEALKWCEKAVAAAKMNPGGRYLLAMILQEQGKPEEAAASLKRALYIDQDFVPAHFALGNLARRQGKPGESARHFENALAVLLRRRPDDIVPESEGITAGRMVEIINTTLLEEALT